MMNLPDIEVRPGPTATARINASMEIIRIAEVDGWVFDRPVIDSLRLAAESNPTALKELECISDTVLEDWYGPYFDN